MTAETAPRTKWVHWLPELTLGLLAFTLYCLTLAPGVLPADAGEFQTAVPQLGVLHPPGFVLYTLLGWLFTLLPLGNPAWQLNLFSAVTSALTVVAVYRAGRYLDPNGWVAAAAAFALAVSTTFWAQATTANIRSLAALFTALIAWAWLAYWQQPNPRRLALLSLALAGGVLHHLSLAFLGLVLGVAALWPLVQRVRAGEIKLKSAVLAVATGLAWLPLLLYLPLRAGAWGAPAGIDQPAGFIQHVLATGFESDFFYFSALNLLPARLAILGNIGVFQFGLPLVVLGGAGLVAAVVRQWRTAGLLMLAIGLHSYVAITYRAPQTVEYLLPAYVLAAVALATVGANQRWVNRVFALLIVVAALPFLLQNWSATRTLAHDDSTYMRAVALLNAAPPDSVIYATWHHATPLWYASTVQGLRPDVTIEYVYPEGDSLAATWVRRVQQTEPQRPVIVTGFYPTEFGGAGLEFSPLAWAWLTHAPPPSLPSTHQPLEDEVILVGVGDLPTTAHPGEEFSVVLAWQALPNPAVTFFVQLLGPDSVRYGGMDIAAGANSPQQHRFDVLVGQNAAPGQYALVAGAYRPDGNRLRTPADEDFILLGSVQIAAMTQRPVTRHPQMFGPLVGYDYDHSLPDSTRLWLHWQLSDQAREWLLLAGETVVASVNVPAGQGFISTTHDVPIGWQNWYLQSMEQTLRLANPQSQQRYVPLAHGLTLTGAWVQPTDLGLTVRLRWQASRPITVDGVVKVDWIGENYAWRAQSDNIPAGGAIPTLKWLPGPAIFDQHTLIRPADNPATPVALELAAYDHFTQQVYAIGDPRLAALSSTIPLPLP